MSDSSALDYGMADSQHLLASNERNSSPSRSSSSLANKLVHISERQFPFLRLPYDIRVIVIHVTV